MDNSVKYRYSDMVGLVCSRDGSVRLKDKNKLPINGVPLALRAVNTLVNVLGMQNIFHLTNIPEFSKSPYSVARPAFLNDGHVPLQDVVKWYVEKNYKPFFYKDAIVLLMPTNPFITEEDIEFAIKTFREKQMNILRSYDDYGQENGLYIIDMNYLLDKTRPPFQYDVYTGGVILPGREIHDEDDYTYAKTVLEGK